MHKLFVCSSAAMSKPSGGIRSLPSLSACGLPTPIVALACICDVDIQVFSGAGVSILPPLKGVTPHGVGRCPQGRGDRSVRGGPAKLVEGFFSLYSSQPISQGVTLLFFFTEKKK
ncbi:hypothetical protein, partial [uncultured Ruminococcus sp.]|uniref:hypothetical protein n=1 Tax=uncultured Ruminococcus sp. TaxID=165186 RepID=UPI00266C9339